MIQRSPIAEMRWRRGRGDDSTKTSLRSSISSPTPSQKLVDEFADSDDGRGIHGAVEDALENARAVIFRTVEGDCIEIGEPDAGFLETESNGVHGGFIGVLNSIQALLFGGGDDHSVFDQDRRRIVASAIGNQVRPILMNPVEAAGNTKSQHAILD